MAMRSGFANLNRSSRLGPRFALLASIVTLCALTVGCTGGMHRRGEHQLTLLGSYDHPIKSGVGLWSAADGRSESAGLALGYNHFVADRFSVGAAVSPYRFFNQSEGDTFGGEFQLALRYYFLDFDLSDKPSRERRNRAAASQSADRDRVQPALGETSSGDTTPRDMRPNVGFFVELLGGMMHTRRSVPEDGTRTNFTQDTGLGMEVRLTDNVSWISGYRLRHFSNCQVFGKDNPSQNEHQVYTGIGISW